VALSEPELSRHAHQGEALLKPQSKRQKKITQTVEWFTLCLCG
jgi:hypothetical protein